MATYVNYDGTNDVTISFPPLTALLDSKDVLEYVIQVGQEISQLPDELISRLFPNLPIELDEAFDIPLLQLEPEAIGSEMHTGWTYYEAIIHDDDLPLMPSKAARRCGLCAQRWPSFVHFLTTPTPPTHLRCPACSKKIPVGLDIREFPERRVQPNVVDLNGAPLEVDASSLNGELPVIDSNQRCTAVDCPLSNCRPQLLHINLA